MSVWYWIIKVEPYDLCHKFDIVISKCSISSSFYIKIFDQEVGGYSWQIISNGFCLSDIVLGFDNYRLSIKWLKANPFKHLLLSNPTTPRPQLGRVTYQKKTDRKKSWLVKVGLDSIKSKTCGWKRQVTICLLPYWNQLGLFFDEKYHFGLNIVPPTV